MSTTTNIPKFKSIKQEADFWDSHDAGEFMDELKVLADIATSESEFVSGEAKTLTSLSDL